jgi:hemerythrin-like domain-containing protein
MTLRQTLQAAPIKTKELIERLKNTSNQALKTRESVFSELKEQLTLYLDQEEQHLLPVLKKHAGTKALAADAGKSGKELRAQLALLDGTAKDTDEFVAQVVELHSLLEKHLRDERKELLPAVLKALDDEDAAGVAAAIEAGFADAEEAKRDERRKAAAKAERDAQREKDAVAAERAVARAQKAAEQEALEAERAAARVQKAADKEAREQAEQRAEAAKAPLVRAVEQTREAVSEVQGAFGAYTGTFQKAAADLRAVSASRSIAAKGATQFVSAWVDWMSKSTRAQAEASRRMLQCRNLKQLAEVQSEMVTNSTRQMIERNAALLEIAQETSKHALRTLETQRAQ